MFEIKGKLFFSNASFFQEKSYLGSYSWVELNTEFEIIKSIKSNLYVTPNNEIMEITSILDILEYNKFIDNLELTIFTNCKNLADKLIKFDNTLDRVETFYKGKNNLLKDKYIQLVSMIKNFKYLIHYIPKKMILSNPILTKLSNKLNTNSKNVCYSVINTNEYTHLKKIIDNMYKNGINFSEIFFVKNK